LPKEARRGVGGKKDTRLRQKSQVSDKKKEGRNAQKENRDAVVRGFRAGNRGGKGFDKEDHTAQKQTKPWGRRGGA